MDPTDNEPLALRKAINAHEQAEAALGDLGRANPDARWEPLIERIQQNLADLRAQTEVAG